MSFYAILDAVLVFAVLIFFLIRTYLRRKRQRFSPTEPPLPVWIMTEFVEVLCLILLFSGLLSKGGWDDFTALLYGLFTIPLSAMLLYCTGRESMVAKEDRLIFTPAVGKKREIPYSDIIEYSVNPSGGILLFLRTEENRYTGAVGIPYLHPDRVTEVLRAKGIREISYEKMYENRNAYLTTLPESETGRREIRRGRARAVRVSGWTLTHLAVISGILFCYRTQYIPSVLFLFGAAVIYLGSAFIAGRMEK